MLRFVLVVVALGGAVALALADDRKVEKKDKVARGGKVKLAPDLDEILELVNKERARQKLPELTVDPILCKVAQGYAELMARKGKTAHELDGQRAARRIEAAGYNWKTVAENLVGTCDMKGDPLPPAEAVEAWMAKKGHRANILNGKHVHTGLGMARDKNGEYYYVQLFASPLPHGK